MSAIINSIKTLTAGSQQNKDEQEPSNKGILFLSVYRRIFIFLLINLFIYTNLLFFFL